MRIYLDACCLSRLTDDQSQPRVRAEADAIENLFRMFHEGTATWVSSTVLSIEVDRNPDPERRRDAQLLLPLAEKILVPSQATAIRARRLEGFGFGAFDALHLAAAEEGNVDVFLTTDDRLLRRAQRIGPVLRLMVENPVSWYLEVQL